MSDVKLFSTNLEKKAIKLCCAEAKTSSAFFGKLDESFFAREATRQAFKRIKKILRKTGELPSYDDLLEDHALDENVKATLRSYEDKPSIKKEKVKILFEKLDEYRRMRVAFDTARDVLDDLKKSDINLEQLFKRFAVASEKAHSTRALPQLTVGEGSKDVLKLTKKILKNSAKLFIPTGFKTFDDVNGGFILGSLVIIGGNSGAGKTTLAGQIAYNMTYKFGKKVCIYSLEMTEEEEWQRQLSRHSKMPLEKIINPKKMSFEEKKLVYKKAKQYEKRLAENGGRLKIISPDRDVTIEEALESMKAYNYDVVIIDYISLLSGVNGDDQVRKLAEASRYAKVWAKSNKKVVIMLAQLKNDGDVKYAGAIKENANNLWAFLRDEKSKQTGLIHIVQPKARMQKDFSFDLLERYDIMTLSDVPEGYEPPEAANENVEEKKKPPKRKHVI